MRSAARLERAPHEPERGRKRSVCADGVHHVDGVARKLRHVATPGGPDRDYTDLRYWADLAKLLDDGGFDALFIADAVGQLDVFGGDAVAALTRGVQTPVTDPLLAVSAMAAATEHSVRDHGVDHVRSPYLLARKFSTLDHLTGGRIGWNIVTSLLDSAARNIIGRDRQIPHDERYAMAQEFLDVTYKLWEGSWEPDAVVRDRERGVFTDPAKVHAIGHDGGTSACPVPIWWNPRRSGPRSFPGRHIDGRS